MFSLFRQVGYAEDRSPCQVGLRVGIQYDKECEKYPQQLLLQENNCATSIDTIIWARWSPCTEAVMAMPGKYLPDWDMLKILEARSAG